MPPSLPYPTAKDAKIAKEEKATSKRLALLINFKVPAARRIRRIVRS